MPWKADVNIIQNKCDWLTNSSWIKGTLKKCSFWLSYYEKKEFKVLVNFRGICGLDLDISWGETYKNHYENQEKVVKHIFN